MPDRKFEIVMLEDAKNFILGLQTSARRKVLYNIQRIAKGEQNAELFKKLEGTNIWEFRTLFGGTHYRLFAFFDTVDNVFIVATHGIIKKTKKTPKKEIEKAETIRRKYFTIKNLK